MITIDYRKRRKNVFGEGQHRYKGIKRRMIIIIRLPVLITSIKDDDISGNAAARLQKQMAKSRHKNNIITYIII